MLFLDISLRQKVTIQNKDICTGTFTDLLLFSADQFYSSW